MTKHIFTAVVAVAILVLGFVIGAHNGYKAAEERGLGGTQYDTARFAGDVRQGLADILMMRDGRIVGPSSRPVDGGAGLATTTNGAGTFTAAQICDNALITATPNVGNVTLTFPSAATVIADCLPDARDKIELVFRNASTTGTAAITIADGANSIHTEGEGNTTVVDVAEWAFLTLMNVDGTNMLLDVEVKQDAD